MSSSRSPVFAAGPGQRRVPALDGLRGLAVIAVVGFHGEWSLLKGGYLGVSLFFTLSGFLITSLLLAESDRDGLPALRAFWSRRFRRLLPVAWLTIAGVAVAAVVLGAVSPDLPGDSWAALGQVANWRFLAHGQHYSDLFGGTASPLLHFWSLAIEEQFYVLFPLVVWVVVRWSANRRRQVLGVVFGLGALASFLAPIIMAMGSERAYLGTDARAGELLAGASLALWVSSDWARAALHGVYAGRRVMVIGLLGAAVSLIAWITVAQSSVLLRTGFLAVVAASSCAMVMGALVPVGPVHRLFTWSPLGWIGRVSYGIYLFHWPLIVWITPGRTGLAHWACFGIAVSASLVLAGVSHRWFERPIQLARWSGQPLFRAVGVASLVVLLLAPVALSERVDRGQALVAALDADVAQFGKNPTLTSPASSGPVPTTPTSSAPGSGSVPLPGSGVPPTTPVVRAPPDPPPTVAMFGDSVLLTLSLSGQFWNRGDRHFVTDGGVVRLGCGIVRGGSYVRDRAVGVAKKCDDWPRSWTKESAQRAPDVSVIMTCQWELVDRQLPGSRRSVSIGDPAYDDLIRSEYGAATDALLANGTRMVEWVTCPYLSTRVGVSGLDPGLRASRARERVDRLNALIREVAASRARSVVVLDFDNWVNERVDNAKLRPDGSHFEHDRDTGVSKAFGTRLVGAWSAWLGMCRLATLWHGPC